MSWAPPRTLPNLTAASVLILDLETRDDGLAKEEGPGWPWRGGYTTGFGVATLDAEWYFPIRHAGGNLDPEPVVRWMRDLARQPRTWVGHNLLYDLGWCTTDGVRFDDGATFEDTNAGAALIDENRPGGYGLDDCAREAGHPGKDTTELVEAYKRLPGAAPKLRGAGKKVKDWATPARANLWQLHSKDVGPYAVGDLAATRHLWLWQRQHLEREALVDIYRLECALLPMLTSMRERGIRVDLDSAEKLWADLQAKEAALERRLKYEYGAFITGTRQAEQIGRACDRLGISYPRTGKRNTPSFTDAWMRAHPHPFFGTLREWRALNTNRMNLEGGVLDLEKSGRIYPELAPLKRDRDAGGTVSGRFSCSNPNTQQASGRSATGKLIRSMYLPEPGELWHSGDVSQQEPRLTVHYAVLHKMEKAAEAAAAFAADKADWHLIVADMVGITRDEAKPINLGMGYGMGVDKLSRNLGKSKAEAQVVLTQYHERLPFVRQLAALCKAKAEERGYIRTLLGRRRRFDYWEPDVYVRRGYCWKCGQAREDAPSDANCPKCGTTPRPEPVKGKEAAARAFPSKPLRRAYTYAAMNALIQGGSADWIKRALLNLWRAKLLPMLQVHDEVDSSVSSREHGNRVAEMMRDAVTLKCPVRVDSGFGANWRDAKAKS